eukprot:jgi/Chlat1/6305/Chrsp44S05789
MPPRPPHAEAAKMARWLAHLSTWGTLRNIVSFVDGPWRNATGTPYFYLTRYDESARDLASDARCSLTISEVPLGSCGSMDPEEPPCAKLTLSGQMVLLTNKDQVAFARDALFSRHPAMKGWPADHHFMFYALNITSIFMIDFYGGPPQLSPAEYFAASLDL